MYIGVEIEMVILRNDELCYDGINHKIINYVNHKYKKIQAQKEYYDCMVEFTFLYPEINQDDFEKFIQDVEDFMDESRDDDEDIYYSLEYSTRLVCSPSTYNGLHLHCQCLPLINKKGMLHLMENVRCSTRFFKSHHIWGGVYPDEYRDWQQSDRYLPVNPNINQDKPFTFEIRAFNCSTISNDFEMIKEIHKTSNLVVKGDNDLTPLDIEFFKNIRRRYV
jgi:hypothetical protein